MISDLSLIADLIRAGTDPELVARVSNAVAQAAAIAASAHRPVDAAAERRRERDREYKAEKRRQKSAESADAKLAEKSAEVSRLPQKSADETDSALYLSSLSSSLETSKEEDKKERKKERNRGNCLPTEWQPNAGHVAAGQKLGFSESQVGEQAEDMRLWAQSNAHRPVARKSDWNLTFLGWLRRNKPKGNGLNGKRSGSILDAIDRLQERLGPGEVDYQPSEHPLLRLPPR